MNIRVFFQSLRVRITLLTLGIFLFSLGGLTYNMVSNLRTELKAMLGENLLSTASIVASDVNHQLELRINSLSAIANHITPALFNNPNRLQEMLQSRFILKNLFNGGFYAIRHDGTAIADVPLSTGRVGMNVSQRGWMQEALKGAPAVGKPVIGARLKVPVFTIAVPIFENSERVIGVLAGVVDLSKPNFLDRIAENRYGSSGDYMLVAPQHNLVVTSSDKSQIMEPLYVKGNNPFVESNIEGYRVFLDYRGVEQLAAIKRVPAAGWYLSVSMPTRDAFAPINELQRRMLFYAVLIVIFAGGITWLILRTHLMPVFTAINRVSAISDTEAPISVIKVERQDEVGKLLGAFNRMIESIAMREAALIESEERHRTILKTAIDGIWLTDMSGNIIEVNDSYCKMTGYAREELQGMNISQIDINETAEDVIEHINTLKVKGSLRFETKHRCKDGALIDVEISSQYRDIDGGRCTAFIHDITERKRLEEQLRQSQKMEAIGILAGGVAHDFNNILQAIIGFTNLARDKIQQDERAKGYLDEVLIAAKKAAELTYSLLAFSRKQTISLKVADLNEIVKNMQKMVQRIIGEDIEFEIVLCENELPVMVDVPQIDQVLLNLVTNARDAMPEGGRLTLKTLQVHINEEDAKVNLVDNPGIYALLEVTDTGVGMDKKTLENVFEPFFTTKTVGKGTGLGLAMVYGIVKQHKGYINLTSELGRGTTFKIYLPVDKAGHEEKAEFTNTPLSSKGETILLAEDDPQVREILKIILNGYGYNLIEAQNGLEAVKQFHEHGDAIDLLIFDVIMPLMNGREAYEDIRKTKPSIKALFISGYNDDIISRKGVLSEGFEFISKPIYAEAMAKKIREILDRP